MPITAGKMAKLGSAANLSRGVRIEIHQSVISAYTYPGGDVYKWARKIALETKFEASRITRLEAVKADMKMSGWQGKPIKKYREFTDGLGGAAIQTDAKIGSRLYLNYSIYHGISTPRDVTWKMSNSSRYARYVFLGTHGPIRSRNGRRMPVGKSQTGFAGVARLPFNSKRVKYRDSVRGQVGKNYPMRALRTILARHQAL